MTATADAVTVAGAGRAAWISASRCALICAAALRARSKNALVLVVQAKGGELRADAFALVDQAFGSAAELASLPFTVADIAA